MVSKAKILYLIIGSEDLTLVGVEQRLFLFLFTGMSGWK